MFEDEFLGVAVLCMYSTTEWNFGEWIMVILDQVVLRKRKKGTLNTRKYLSNV